MWFPVLSINSFKSLLRVVLTYMDHPTLYEISVVQLNKDSALKTAIRGQGTTSTSNGIWVVTLKYIQQYLGYIYYLVLTYIVTHSQDS